MTAYLVNTQTQGAMPRRIQVSRGNKNFDPVVVKAVPNTVYVFGTLDNKPLAKVVVKQVGIDLQVFLDGDTSGQPDVLLQGYALAQQSVVLATLSAEAGKPFVGFTEADAASTGGAAGSTAGDLSSGGFLTLQAKQGGSGWFGVDLDMDSPFFWPAVLGGTLALSAIGGGGSGNSSDSSPNASLTTITTYSTAATPTSAPTLSDYTNAGFDRVTSNNFDLVNTAVRSVKANTSDKIKAVVTAAARVVAKANGTEADTTTDDPTVEDFKALGVSLLGIEETSSAQSSHALGLLVSILKTRVAKEVDSVAKINAMAATVDKLMLNAKGNIPPTQLTQADLNSIGLTEITDADGLAGFLSAVTASADDGSKIASLTALKDIADAYLKVLALADGTRSNADPSHTPSQADYAKIGITNEVLAQAPALALLNDTIDGLAKAKVAKAVGTSNADVGNTINGLVTAIDKIEKIRSASSDEAAAAVGLTVAELTHLGFTQASNSNLGKIIAAIRASKAEADSLTTYSKLQNAVNLGLVAQFADTLPGDVLHIAPTLQLYKDAGLAQTDSGSTKAITAGNLAALNSAAEALKGSDVITTTKLQAVLNAFGKILGMADGTRGNASAVTATLNDYKAVGALSAYDTTTGSPEKSQDARTSKALGDGAQKGAALKLINDVVDGVPSSRVDSVQEINQISIAVDKALDLASGSAGAVNLTTQELSYLGLTGGSDGNIARVNGHIKAMASADGAAVDTVAELQAVVSLSVVQHFVNSPATNPEPTQQNYKDLLFTGISWDDNLTGATNSVVKKLGSADAATLGKLQSVVSAFQSILNEAGDTANTKTNPSKMDYETVLLRTDYSLSSTDADLAGHSLSLINDLVRNKSKGGVDSYDELRVLAEGVGSLMALAKGEGSVNGAALSTMGFTVGNWNDSTHTSKFTNFVGATLDNGSGIDTFAEVQALINKALL